VARNPGGGHKVNLFKNFMQNYKNDENQVILFVDSYDVIITSDETEILKRFNEIGAKVLFSSEGFCWPDKSLESQYPKTEGGGKAFLNSGGFIGFAPQIYEIVSSSKIDDLSDDQLFYTKVYLDENLRKKLKIKLDHKSAIFQNLNGAVGDVEIRFTSDDAYIQNTAYQTNPLVIHGNGPSKVALNSLGNYLAKSWHPKSGCNSCNENKLNLEKLKNSELPLVLIGIFITHATPFLSEFFQYIVQLKYPKKRISLFLYNNVEYHLNDTQKFLEEKRDNYKRVTVFALEKLEWEARNSALDECVKINCDFYFSIDSDARITNSDTLIRLMEQNKSVIAPLLVRSNQLWSNFWGALSSEGYYSRSHDYIQIVKRERLGVWNVPFISEAYLINGSLLKEYESNQIESHYSPSFYSSHYPQMDADMTFCNIMRDNGVFMFVTNLEDFGHLVTSSTFDTTKKHPDFYEIYSNQKDWQNRYIHENYSKVLSPEFKIEQPCPDVYWFPVVSPIFCKHLIEIMENFGQWSAGKNYDSRLAGGYENVPTRDIHMNQVGFEQHWLYFLREYIRPVQEKVFIGYFHDVSKINID
jgi:procollagen-lysine,2-oxoglutarate 5-dioxygenase